jgi:hypothetical protein
MIDFGLERMKYARQQSVSSVESCSGSDVQCCPWIFRALAVAVSASFPLKIQSRYILPFQ